MNQKYLEWCSILISYPCMGFLYNLYQNKKKNYIINEPKDIKGER